MLIAFRTLRHQNLVCYLTHMQISIQMFRRGISKHVPRMFNTGFVGRFSHQVLTFSTQAEHPRQEVNNTKEPIPRLDKDEARFMAAVRSSHIYPIYKHLKRGIPVALASRALFNVERIGILRTLLRRANADINYVGDNGFSPLMIALERKIPHIAKAMIAAQADVNYTTAFGKTPLSSAVVNCPDFVETLLEAGAVIPAHSNIHGHDFLLFAIHRNAHNIVEAMLPSVDRTAVNQSGNNFLAVAAKHADEKTMGMVLNHVTIDELNAVNRYNESILDIAASFNTPAVVRLLLDAKAEVKRSSGVDASILNKAINRGDMTPEGMLQTLVEAGADTEALNDIGNTVLHSAAFGGYTGVVDTLISLKADIHRINQNGLTPLMAALSKGHTDVAESLLAAGATASGKRCVKQLVMDAGRGNEASVAILIKAKVNVNARNRDGITALEAAVNAGHLSIFETLLDAGATATVDRSDLP
jgi:ankyrin repeat protein